ncbi:N-acetylmuramoyl-L-alanine amidase [Clostridium gasigenes]|uniref:N-acetylmuramoyl-L-alanine amidase n=1 Tax=Clostridium gasigenes TaxID=94869 RepID=A0A1H0N9I2_9CLOT|nr:N-acetylmuramoyl-L-alanine amidase [Clostridium gasigenes]MBB6623870.1 N-acetylmuramoyl-L-alanine amidase [Clostridium gasigenes]MBU3087416.1 N-acetylmuramoyl-L-alanine amidase [Clostridium gasigenes]SDO89347.1 N-acetylmuramoyl-L-alanine amidase [Clostridium gasigenes]
MKIVIDYGHCLSGYDTGASGNGYREEICTREIGKRIKSKLEKLGHAVYAIAPDYSNSVRESLNVRVNSANSKSAEISVSIHLNAGGGRGIEIYTKNGQAFSQATNILKNICEMGYVNRGIKDGSELALVGSIWTNSMLIECGFIDNESDMKIYNPEKIADAIVKGLVGSTVSIPDRETSGENSNGGTINKNKYLNLSPSVTSWRVYPLGKSPVVGNEVGKLAPSQYGGLSYLILGSPSVDIYTIETSVWGKVNIYAPSNDSSCSFTNNSNDGGSPSVPSTVKYLNLSPSVSSWRVYPLGKNPVIGNEIGSLAPVTYGGLSYEIKGNPIGDVYTIITSVWGKVNIYAPRDNESTITSRPSY